MNKSDQRAIKHTIRLPVEEVVVLGEVGDDAQTIRRLGGNHVLWVQQSRDAQLRLCDLKSLQTRKKTNRGRRWMGVKQKGGAA